jgi:hypothetical protein
MQIPSVFTAVYMRKTPSGLCRHTEPPRGADRGRWRTFPAFLKAAVLTHADLRHGDAMPKAQVGGREERRRSGRGRCCRKRRLIRRVPPRREASEGGRGVAGEGVYVKHPKNLRRRPDSQSRQERKRAEIRGSAKQPAKTEETSSRADIHRQDSYGLDTAQSAVEDVKRSSRDSRN